MTWSYLFRHEDIICGFDLLARVAFFEARPRASRQLLMGLLGQQQMPGGSYSWKLEYRRNRGARRQVWAHGSTVRRLRLVFMCSIRSRSI